MIARTALVTTLVALTVVLGACDGGTNPTATATGVASPVPSPTATAPATSTVTATATMTTPPSATTAPTAMPVVTPGASVTPAPTPAPTSTAIATPAPPDPIVRLKYRLFDRFGWLWYCDPDYYPVARADEADLARERFPEIQADAATFSAILEHMGIALAGSYTADQQLAIYRDWKMLRALTLQPGGGAYAFNARFTRDGSTGVLAEGTIDTAGTITVGSETPADQPNCPICLARGARIATPDGPIAVEALRAGMRVWTASANGARVAASVMTVGQTTAPPDHEVVDLVLADGRELRVSPGHPLADGRLVGELVAGDTVDGSAVVSTKRVPYGGGTTFDLLPSGPTATYWADGVPLKSTLH